MLVRHHNKLASGWIQHRFRSLSLSLSRFILTCLFGLVASQLVDARVHTTRDV